MVVRKEILPGPRPPRTERNRLAIDCVVDSLLRCLPLAEQTRLGIVAPGRGRTCDREALLIEVSLRTRRSPHAARCLVRAVYSALGRTSPELASRVRAGVSPDVLVLLGETRRPGEWSRETPPRRRTGQLSAAGHSRSSPGEPPDPGRGDQPPGGEFRKVRGHENVAGRFEFGREPLPHRGRR